MPHGKSTLPLVDSKNLRNVSRSPIYMTRHETYEVHFGSFIAYIPGCGPTTELSLGQNNLSRDRALRTHCSPARQVNKGTRPVVAANQLK